jgi:hypothetical protein
MVVSQEIQQLKNLLDSFLGESKQDLDDSLQLEYPCPCCIEKYGHNEARKYNLSLSLRIQRFQCWKCASEGEDSMRGSIIKLIRKYGNETILEEYKRIIQSIRDSELYKLNFNENDFNIDTSVIENEELKFPSSFKFFKQGEHYNHDAMKYLVKRGIGWDIIDEYKIGYTEWEEENKKGSFRIIVPSYSAMGELNYWVGRDYLPKSKYRLKYDNPKVEKKSIVFNEEKIQWDADITLVEGPFDHIVVPNSVPLLGKALNKEYKLYWDLLEKANGRINVMLDSDAFQTVLETYKLLNHGRLYGKIRYIPIENDEDPSSLYQKGGYKEIARHLANAQQIKEVYL